MLIIEDSTGVPSVAAWLRVDSSANLKPGSITGQVTDSTTGLGISGATVSYSGGSSTTDANGGYRLIDIPSGQHEVTVSAPGYATVRRTQSVQPEEVVTLDLELTVAGTVSGRVTAMDTGAAVGGATITYTGGSTTTDVDGNYLITDIAPGSQALVASASGYHSAEQAVVVVGHGSASLDFALAVKQASIRGEIEDAATGEPIVGATVQYSGGVITTNDLGFYRFENVSPGAHLVTVSTDGYLGASSLVNVVAGSAAIIDLDFRLNSTEGPRPTLTASYQDGLLPDPTYAGTRDTFIRSGTATRNYGAATVLEVVGKPDDAALLRWDLRTIPAGSKVRSATLTVNVVNKTVQNFEIYELERNWAEGQATWNDFSTGTRWEIPGASGATDRGSTVLGSATAPALGIQDINLNADGLAVVESWINNPAANNGIIIQNYADTASDDIDFSSRENPVAASRPKLSVTYELNVPPVLDAIGDQSGDEGSLLIFRITASDANRDRLTYTAAGLPDGASFDAATRTFSWTPGEAQDGTHSVTFSVSDGTATDSETMTIMVGEVNQPPVLSPIGNKSVDEGSRLSFTISASDDDIVDGLPQPLTYSPLGAPLGAAFDETTRIFSWTPSPDQDGIYTVGFLADDGGAVGAFETITITVGAPVLAPIGDKSVDEESLLSFKISATDAGHDLLTYSTGPLPTGATFDPDTQIFSWIPSRDQDGNYTVALSVTDGKTTDSETITITVGAPVLATIGNKSVDEGKLLSFKISATDAGNDTLTYSTGVLPTGTVFDSGSQTLSWTPAENQDGT
ncbi:MAG: carboxypeptidase regulatory-like domain-containing protein, partial [Planctomycetes bacterium]|nr:carboxypeptidase regulatory-like domain-containing protein [Planctomycetota bacterium]